MNSDWKFLGVLGLILLGMGLFSIFIIDLEDVLAYLLESEIEENQVDDKISRTVYVKIQDGIYTSDDIR